MCWMCVVNVLFYMSKRTVISFQLFIKLLNIMFSFDFTKYVILHTVKICYNGPLYNGYSDLTDIKPNSQPS